MIVSNDEAVPHSSRIFAMSGRGRLIRATISFQPDRSPVPLIALKFVRKAKFVDAMNGAQRSFLSVIRCGDVRATCRDSLWGCPGHMPSSFAGEFLQMERNSRSFDSLRYATVAQDDRFVVRYFFSLRFAGEDLMHEGRSLLTAPFVLFGCISDSVCSRAFFLGAEGPKASAACNAPTAGA